jgi:hypothetical protein
MVKDRKTILTTDDRCSPSRVAQWTPAGLIEDENGVRAAGDLGGDVVEMKLRAFTVAHRQHEGGAGAAIRADRTEQVGRLGALIMGGAEARALAAQRRLTERLPN